MVLCMASENVFPVSDFHLLQLLHWRRYSHSGTDLGRLNVARHGLAMCICDTLYSLGVTYSMPTFTGPRQPGQAVPADMSRPLTGSQVPLQLLY